MATGCNDAGFDDPAAPEHSKDYITLSLSLAPGTRVTDTVDGETSNENKINTVDLFFYESEAVDTDRAKYAMHESSITDDGEMPVSVKKLTEAFGDDVKKCKVVAVVNCDATKSLAEKTNPEEYPTIAELKQTQLSAKDTKDGGIRAFRSAAAPRDFVMTNLLTEPTAIEWNEDGGLQESYTIKLKRVAAKIRVALDVVDSITDENGTWMADKDDIRLFISNGVTKGQLDGSHIELTAPNDYYSIATSGSTGEESDYALAREVNEHSKTASGAPTTDSEDFPYYNEIPYYTYPNQWENSMMDNTQTKLTIVVPWKKTEILDDGQEDVEYRPSYYSIPVNNGTTIEPNKYYYLRLHIGMMGSVTPELPMPVDMECTIAEWIKAETHANIRPVRFLIFNQKEFVMNNKTEITIPFTSTHNTKVVGFKGVYYGYKSSTETELWFDDDSQYGTTNGNSVKVKGNIYDYSLNTTDNTLTFTHRFFDAIFDQSGGSNDTNGTNNTTIKKDENGNNYYYKDRVRSGSRRLLCAFDVYITVQHSTEDASVDAAYQETVHITCRPPIYIQSITNSGDSGERGREQAERGYLYVNGQDNGSSHFYGAYGRTSSSKEALTIITVTQIDKNDDNFKVDNKPYEVDDPRTYYINNILSDASMAFDDSDHDQTNPWTTTGGNQEPPTTAPTIWSKLSDYDVFWDDSGDKENRTIKYYYPASSKTDAKNKIAPQLLFSSEYGYTGTTMSTDVARRRCAVYQEYGFPAGRWRLPTEAERKYARTLQDYGLIPSLFTGENYTTADQLTGNHYIRCVYDLWFWTDIDKQTGEKTYNRIPLASPYDDSQAAKVPGKTIMWGDRPTENTLASAADGTDGQTRAAGGTSFTVQDFLQKNAPGNYAVIRDGEDVRLEKLETAE